MTERERYLSGRLPVIVSIALCVALVTPAAITKSALHDLPQENFPDPPNDVTRVYYMGTERKLLPLPFEAGMSSLNVFVPAAKDKVVQLRLKGPIATTILAEDKPRFYVFIGDRMDPPPHQLVRLARKKSEREVSISVIKGRPGYAPFARDNVKLARRILERLRVESSRNRYVFVNYMELRPLNPLAPGEYAIIGDSLRDMATFRIK